MGKNYSDNLHSIKNTAEIFTLKQMFEISEQLILEQTQISWESSSWKHLYLVNDEEVISLSHAKVYVFSDSVLCLGKMRTQHQILLEKDCRIGSKIHLNRELWTQLTENRWNSSGIFPRIHFVAARPRSPTAHEQNGRTPTIPRT